MSGHQDFARQFGEVVVPRIERAIRFQAYLLVTRDDMEWHDAKEAVWLVATKAGAMALPHALIEQLNEFVDREMLSEFQTAELGVARVEARLERIEQREPIGYWRRMVETTAPERQKAMEQVAIGLSPGYRRWWNRQQGPSLADRRKANGKAR